MSKPIIAIVGRPNVGKSTLFNKLTGKRTAIVEDIPGITRDRIYGETEWRGKKMILIDTGGIDAVTDDPILVKMRAQAQIAIDTADVIIFVCDIRSGLVSDDMDIALMLKKCGKPVIPVVNKIDSVGTPPADFYDFYSLGFEAEPIALSALHGSGSGDLLDEAMARLPEFENEEEQNDVINVAVIGKPNAGKSSLINRILSDDRLIVSDIPGTTRDAIDTYFENEHGKYNFIDTAGLRRQSKVEDRIEKFSVIRAKAAVERADVCLLVVDAGEGVTEQDEKIAGIVHEAGKGIIICVNKWDTIDKDNSVTKKFTNDVYTALSFMTYAPLIFISAKTGQRVDKLFEKINAVKNMADLRISTGMLNDVLSDAVTRVQPPSDKGRRLKIYYMTQTGVAPPTFVLFCNRVDLFHFSYQRYIENCLRSTFGFDGTPIKMIIKQKNDGDKA